MYRGHGPGAVALHLFYALRMSVVIVIYITWEGFRHEWQWCWGPLHEYFYRILQHLGMISALIAVVLGPYESEFL